MAALQEAAAGRRATEGMLSSNYWNGDTSLLFGI
jgi:hypothetical protein